MLWPPTHGTKIFAIFRLASDGDEYDIIVNYNMTVLKLFTDVVRTSIELSGKLSIILPRRPASEGHNLPSWCPDWSSCKPASKLGNWQDVHPFQVSPDSSSYCAAGKSVADVQFPGRSLVARGFLLDSVRGTSRHAYHPVVVERKGRSHSPSLFCSLLDCFWPTVSV